MRAMRSYGALLSWAASCGGAAFVALAGCQGSPSTEGYAQGGSEALKGITPDEIIGSLAYGQTSAPVSYTPNPHYRVFSFTGHAGDAVDVWVRSSSGGYPRAWLLASDDSTLETGKYANGDTTQTHIHWTLGTTGTFYTAFRDVNMKPGVFTVELDGPALDGGSGDGGAVLSYFDDSLLTGTPITAQQAAALFAPGSTTAALGQFGVQERVRSCNQTTGCAGWLYPPAVTFAYMTYELWIPGPGWGPQEACEQFAPAQYSSVTGNLSLVLGNGGEIDLQLASSTTGTVTCTNAPGGSAACGELSTASPPYTPGPSCNLPNPDGSGFDTPVYPASVTLYDTSQVTGSPLSLSALVTTGYVYARTDTQSPVSSNGSYTEVQYAFYGYTTPGAQPPPMGGSTCVPTTCAAENATCGTIPDGCGGTLTCGSCDSPYYCSTNQCVLPAGCNLQPCYAGATQQYTCCAAGQVTCSNGQGCTCYDACY